MTNSHTAARAKTALPLSLRIKAFGPNDKKFLLAYEDHRINHVSDERLATGLSNILSIPVVEMRGSISISVADPKDIECVTQTFESELLHPAIKALSLDNGRYILAAFNILTDTFNINFRPGWNETDKDEVLRIGKEVSQLNDAIKKDPKCSALNMSVESVKIAILQDIRKTNHPSLPIDKILMALFKKISTTHAIDQFLVSLVDVDENQDTLFKLQQYASDGSGPGTLLVRSCISAMDVLSLLYDALEQFNIISNTLSESSLEEFEHDRSDATKLRNELDAQNAKSLESKTQAVDFLVAKEIGTQSERVQLAKDLGMSKDKIQAIVLDEAPAKLAELIKKTLVGELGDKAEKCSVVVGWKQIPHPMQDSDETYIDDLDTPDILTLQVLQCLMKMVKDPNSIIHTVMPITINDVKLRGQWDGDWNNEFHNYSNTWMMSNSIEVINGFIEPLREAGFERLTITIDLVGEK